MSTATGAEQGLALDNEIEAWANATFGPACAVRNVGSLGGHSGVTIGFDVVDGARVIERLVLKMAPPGVARRNNFDVLRQVPLLKALEASGIPAPRARYWSDDEEPFGGPYLMMSRLAGCSPPDLFRDDAACGLENADLLFDRAVDVLVDIHAIDPAEALPDWNVARDPDEEIEHWARILKKTSDPSWLEQGYEVRDRLHRTKPADIAIGVLHGDYYSNNWVFDGNTLSGVVDWEGTTIGPSLMDLGWLYMIYDRSSWGPSRHRYMDWQPDPERLVARYFERSTHDSVDLGWYRALAAYRLASITAYYYEEHRSGRRRNAAWEMFAEAFPLMLARSQRLLADREA